MNETKQKGLITELHCQLAFSENGILLSVPITEDSRYDFIADINGILTRIQCKTCSLFDDGNAITFTTRSVRSNTSQSYERYYTKEEIDYFYTYYNGKSYLVKVEETSSQKTLRFVSKSNQNINVNWAKDFELETVLKNDFQYTFEKIQVNIKNTTKSTKFCIDCGAPISSQAVRCEKCNSLKERIVDRPDREKLKNLIRTTPFVQIAKQYGVSDKAVTKWCISENLPSRKVDIKKYSDEEWRLL